MAVLPALPLEVVIFLVIRNVKYATLIPLVQKLKKEIILILGIIPFIVYLFYLNQL